MRKISQTRSVIEYLTYILARFACVQPGILSNDPIVPDLEGDPASAS